MWVLMNDGISMVEGFWRHKLLFVKLWLMSEQRFEFVSTGVRWLCNSGCGCTRGKLAAMRTGKTEEKGEGWEGWVKPWWVEMLCKHEGEHRSWPQCRGRVWLEVSTQSSLCWCSNAEVLPLRSKRNWAGIAASVGQVADTLSVLHFNRFDSSTTTQCWKSVITGLWGYVGTPLLLISRKHTRALCWQQWLCWRRTDSAV